ncbi:amidase [Lutimaribacter sp. EGI FJ00015]|uniref:Amidase n=1 Tax=Lutimaribacter degradans TaxID=2945989 RepID=A0ACC6A029_9RHOB|nr:amidase [Lutimaribacter sp. EGI FJ00013]MCM2562964.1 amidase [Lutimaribacter sp. EGI FJ00013]MCO0614132.1 amidase [Lutimaribacter sp. EGI FJ00015]MCO0636109.1 amidase [Lutimaribacter sp. EGI FJ00014]
MIDTGALFDQIAARDAALHFCEDFTASGPVDRAQAVGAGPLAGRVIGIKANIAVAGQGWTAGIGARASRIAAADASVVAALRGAGATLVSRLAMDEGALGASTDNPHFGRCENVAYPGHSAGGSSGGAAVAVAAGLVDAALGSDTMGSVRIPAAYCGVYGLKVGQGVLPLDGVVPLAPSLDALGIFARTPAAISEVLDVLAHDGPFRETTGWHAPGSEWLGRCTPDVAAFFKTCSTLLGGFLGQPGEMPEIDLDALRADAFLLTEIEGAQSLGAEPGLSPGLQKLLDYGAKVPEEKAREVRARLEAAARCLTDGLGPGSVALLPTVAEPAFAHGSRPPVGQADFTVLANVAGLPALAIPAPESKPPVSVQLLGPKGSERELLALAERLASAL